MSDDLPATGSSSAPTLRIALFVLLASVLVGLLGRRSRRAPET